MPPRYRAADFFQPGEPAPEHDEVTSLDGANPFKFTIEDFDHKTRVGIPVAVDIDSFEAARPLLVARTQILRTRAEVQMGTKVARMVYPQLRPSR